MNMKTVSIIINTYNRCECLERALSSLRYLRYPQFEVVCVNGPSEDDTSAMLADWAGRIKLSSCAETNLSVSRNIGIRMAAGDIVCFMDDDAIPEPSWLDSLVAEYDNPKVAAVGGFIRDHTGVNWQARYVFCDRFGRAIFFDNVDDIKIRGKKPEEYGTDYYVALTGTNSSFRRDVLVELGGFDETFAYFLDETDVLLRIADRGYTIVCVGHAEVHHKFAPSHLRNTDRIPKSLYYPIRSRAYFAWRHGLPRYGLGATLHALKMQVMESTSSVAWHAAQNHIDQEFRSVLMEEIRCGESDGFELAFNVVAPFTRPPTFFANPEPFMPFALLLPIEKRYKLCFISQDYTPNPNGGIGVWVSALARGLAGLGHEISVVTRASEKFPTVDYEDGVWVHRIVQKHFPERPYAVPEDLPQLVYDWAASAHTETLRIKMIRGLDVVSAPIWDVEGIVAH
ncbi:MAG: glycosyltransferase, partial [Desulfovibrio sp.]|nr:glycosyltransferase [Desulfovibrio sp.]